MKKLLLFIAITSCSIQIHAQDLTKISSYLLGIHGFEIDATLDSINVWHYRHLPNKVAKQTIVLTVEDAQGVSYLLKATINDNTKIIERVTVNFSHANSKQIKALRKLSGYDDFHVGVNSTDVYYNLDGKAGQPYGLEKVIDK